MSEQREYPALEPLTYRWRAKDSKHWIYDPTPAWIEDHRHEVDIEPLYGPAEIASLRAPQQYQKEIASLRARINDLQGGAERYWEGRWRDTEAQLACARKALEAARWFVENSSDAPRQALRVVQQIDAALTDDLRGK